MPISIWSDERYPVKVAETKEAEFSGPKDWRSSFQKDYDRLLFSTPVRRLADKTQVWPMEENDGVRTRLTHSHEVSNLARSIGSRIAKEDPTIFDADIHDVVQPLLSVIGLAHDLGNPPFGHRGEAAIGQWFENRKNWIFTKTSENGEHLEHPISEDFYDDFIEFDGNPQTLRLLTKLQTSVAHVGLHLTAATLMATLKYPVSSKSRDKSKPYIKKIGYFESERDIVTWARERTGMKEAQRHPLTWIMEACDDIAYSVLDVDDVMKKGIISPNDILQILKSNSDLDRSDVIKKIEDRFEKVDSTNRRAEIARDIKIDYLRATLIEAMVVDVSTKFINNKQKILNLNYEDPLAEDNRLCNALKKVAQQYAFGNSDVLKTEALGSVAIDGLMTFFWNAITERKKVADFLSRRLNAKASYSFSLISQNYIEDVLRSTDNGSTAGTMRYKELRLLTDMVSGMTDTFAIKIWQELKSVPDVNRP
jgi:dGTPase